MTRQSRQFISKYSHLLDVLKSAPKGIWLQIHPLTGPQSGYERLYNVCRMDRSTLSGLFLRIGILKYSNNVIYFQRGITEEIQLLTNSSLKFDRRKITKDKQIQIWFLYIEFSFNNTLNQPAIENNKYLKECKENYFTTIKSVAVNFSSRVLRKRSSSALSSQNSEYQILHRQFRKAV